jgi:hypothetical protein
MSEKSNFVRYPQSLTVFNGNTYYLERNQTTHEKRLVVIGEITGFHGEPCGDGALACPLPGLVETRSTRPAYFRRNGRSIGVGDSGPRGGGGWNRDCADICPTIGQRKCAHGQKAAGGDG